MRNKMKEVAKLLDVEIEERFNIVEHDTYNPYCLYEDVGLVDCDNMSATVTLSSLLTGKLTIERPPFKPKIGDFYFYISPEGRGNIIQTRWKNSLFDYYCYNANNCFKTSEEITGKNILRVIKEMKELYDNK